MESKYIATKGRTLEIVEKYGHRMNKGFGQNFIIDPNVVIKIAKTSSNKDLTTIEIGPGIGALTEQLAIYSKRVIAYEIDDKLIDVLADTLGDYDNVEIRHTDFLNVDLNNEDYADEEIVVTANLPYYVTTPILFKLFESNLKIKSINVMMQKEVADRLLAKPNTKEYSALSIIVSYLYDVKKLMDAKKQVFYPSPNVDSIVVSLFPKSKDETIDDQDKFFEVIKACFKYRRKTLNNNLKELIGENTKTVLENLGFENKRAEDLTLEDFKRLYHEIKSIC